jgi:hypothetical protein
VKASEKIESLEDRVTILTPLSAVRLAKTFQKMNHHQSVVISIPITVAMASFVSSGMAFDEAGSSQVHVPQPDLDLSFLVSQ